MGVSRMNQVVLVGRLVQDPVLKHTSTNIPYCNFTLAVPKRYDKEKADFIECVAWRRMAENLCNYMQKGSLIAIDGMIETNSFESKDGEKKRRTTVNTSVISFLERAKSSPYRTLTNEEKLEYIQQEKSQSQYVSEGASEIDEEFKKLLAQGFNVNNDDLPF